MYKNYTSPASVETTSNFSQRKPRSLSKMGRRNVEFKTTDGVTLRGWFYTPQQSSGKIPCLVMAHGWTALKEMGGSTDG